MLIRGARLGIGKRIAWAIATGCFLTAAGLYLCVVDVSAAFAQAPNDDADPGQIRRRIEETRPKPVEPQPRPVLVPEEAAPAAGAIERPSFVLSAVVFEGNTIFAAGDLGFLYEDFLARAVTLAEVQEITQRVTKKYQDAGYILSRAIVPPQGVQGGVLVVRVIEGYVARVRFDGAPGQEDILAPYADKITAVRPINLAALERYLLLINDLAGFSVRNSAVQRMEEEGAHEITVTIGYDAFDGVAYVDNRGTPSVGRLQSWLSGAANSMFGLGERVQLGFFTIPNQPRELLYGEFSYQQPVGSEGTTLTATASASLVDPGASLAALDTEGQSTRFSLRATHPILRARGGNLSVSGSIDILDVGEDRLGVTNFDDHLRVFRVGLDYLRDDSWDGTTTVAVEVSQGIDILGASNAGDTALSRPDGDGVFTKVTAKLTRTQQIGQEFSIWAAIKGQISADPLLSAEEFSLGGSEFGRAYDFSEITGEDGIAGSVELRYGKSLNQEILKAFQIYGFYDLGAVWNDDTQGDSRESLASAGAGLRLTLPQSIFATAEVAKPLTRTVSTTGDQDWRAFFSLSANF